MKVSMSGCKWGDSIHWKYQKVFQFLQGQTCSWAGGTREPPPCLDSPGRGRGHSLARFQPPPPCSDLWRQHWGPGFLRHQAVPQQSRRAEQVSMFLWPPLCWVECWQWPASSSEGVSRTCSRASLVLLVNTPSSRPFQPGMVAAPSCQHTLRAAVALALPLSPSHPLKRSLL